MATLVEAEKAQRSLNNEFIHNNNISVGLRQEGQDWRAVLHLKKSADTSDLPGERHGVQVIVEVEPEGRTYYLP